MFLLITTAVTVTVVTVVHVLLCFARRQLIQRIVWSFLQLIVLSASANKLAKLKEQAEEYASLIMEELDPENLGYIEVRVLSPCCSWLYTSLVFLSSGVCMLPCRHV